MPRYYFHVIAAERKVLDLEGTELANIDMAEAEGKQDARALMSEAILEGRDISERSVEICDEDSQVLLVIPFKSAYTRES